MSESEDKLPIDRIAESFALRIENGETPSIGSYVERYPDLADEIKQVLPAIALLGKIDIEPEPPHLSTDVYPTEIGDFRIVREIGRGGMGIVFEAEHLSMKRRVALKVLPKSYVHQPQQLSRFHAEARSAGQLHHTNIVPVFEFGEADGVHYYAMQFIRGDNLDRVIEEVRRLQSSSNRSNGTGRKSIGQKRPADLSWSIAKQILSGQSAGTEAFQPGVTQPINNGSANRLNNESVPPKLKKTSHAAPFELTESIGNVRSGDSCHHDASHSLNSLAAEQISRMPSGDTKEAYFKRVAVIGVQVAEALDHAHEHGVLHRDIKPANLILDTLGKVWVTDFGLAKRQSDDLTQTGDIVGTLRYMAPERFDGVADSRSDIYSLGLTLYELCTLQSAFGNDRDRLVKNVVDSTVVVPRKVDPAIPLDLETIILKSIEYDPDRRYRTAGLIVDDLNRFLEDRPILARRISVGERVWRTCRRNPLSASLVACVFCLLVFVGASLIRISEMNASQARADQESKDVALVQLFYAKLEQAKMQRLSRRLGQRTESLKAIETAVNLLPDLDFERIVESQEQLRLILRNEVIAALALPDLEQFLRSSSTQGKYSQYRYAVESSCGRFAQCDANGQIIVRSVEDNLELIRLPAPNSEHPAWQMEFSTDGRFLAAKHHAAGASAKKMELVVWDLENTANPVLKAQGVRYFAFSGNSQKLAYAVGEAVELVAVPSMKSLGTITSRQGSVEPDQRSNVRRVCFNHVGSELAICNDNSKSIEFWNVESEQSFVRQIEAHQEILSFDWDSNQELFVVGTHRGELMYWENGWDSEPKLLPMHQNSIYQLHIHPTRRIVVSSAWDNTSRVADLLSGKEVILANELKLTHSGFGDKGQIAFTDGNDDFGIWKFKKPLLDSYRDTEGYGWNVAFHPKLPRVVANTTDQTVEFWDTENKRRLASLPNCEGPRDLRFSRDGRILFTSGKNGLQCWRVLLSQRDGDVQCAISELDPLIDEPTGYFELTLDEKTIVIGIGSRVETINATNGNERSPFGVHSGLQVIQLTADDRYLLTGTYQGKGVKVWDMATRELLGTVLSNSTSVIPVADPNNSRMFWSSDSDKKTRVNRLVLGAGTESNRPIELDSQLVLQESLGKVGYPVFSSRGNLLGMKSDELGLILIDTVSKCPIAQIETHDKARVIWHKFSPDDSYIALACYKNLQIVSLKELRIELDKLGLDWRPSQVQTSSRTH